MYAVLKIGAASVLPPGDAWLDGEAERDARSGIRDAAPRVGDGEDER